MKETEDAKRSNFFKIIIFLVDIAVNVFRKYVGYKLLEGEDIYEFLSKHRHALYHQWLYNIPCCSSRCEIEKSPLKRPHISLMHLETMYNINGPEKDGHEQRDKGKVLQHCICKVSVKSGIYLGALDITTCYILLTRFMNTTHEQKKWLKCIIEQRNTINTHLHEKILEHDEFVQMWEKLEIPILLIAGSIDKLYADEIYNNVKVLAKLTPSMKKYVKCYETYLEWFSRDDILRQEINHTKLKKRQNLATVSAIPEDQERKGLVIIEDIMINLLKNPDGVQTEVERHTQEVIDNDEADTEKKDTSEKFVFKDAVISGPNTLTQPTTSNEPLKESVTMDDHTLSVQEQLYFGYVSGEELKEVAKSETKFEQIEEASEKSEIDVSTQTPITKLQNQTSNAVKNGDVQDQTVEGGLQDQAPPENATNDYLQDQTTKNEKNSDLLYPTKDRDSREQTTKDEDNVEGQDNTKETENKKIHEAGVTLDIPGKTRFQNRAIVNTLQKQIDNMEDDLIFLTSVCLNQDSITLTTQLSTDLFLERTVLRRSFSRFLHKLFKLCRISDCFSVKVSITIYNPVGIDMSLFNTKEPADERNPKEEKPINKDSRAFAVEPLNVPVPEDTPQPKDCPACRAKDKEIFNLHKQVIKLQGMKDSVPLVKRKCKDCVLKDKKIFLMEQDHLKIMNDMEHKDRLITSLQTDIEAKETTITTYTRLQHTNDILDKQINVGKNLKNKAIPHLKKFSSTMFYTRPTSEPPQVWTKLPPLPSSNGKWQNTERPISEQVLIKSKPPSISTSQKKYLSSIRRYAEFFPTRKLEVLNYSVFESRSKGPLLIPRFPPLSNVDGPLLRPISVRGKHMTTEQKDIKDMSKVAESGKRSKIVLHLSLPRM